MFEANGSLCVEFASVNISSDDLPIAKYKSKIIDAVLNNKVTIIYGETGSGKTTQIPQYLFNEGIHNDLVIAVTQPRKIAAISMARRVAQEMGCCLGKEVGYEVRFQSKCQGSTKIVYMTDGMLLNRCLSDPKLSQYGVIMIDEAHERTINTDVLLGLLKMIVKKRDDLKVLITSATIKTKKFSTYFNDALEIGFKGRLFPVEVIYHNSFDYLDSAEGIVDNIHKSSDKGDILIFLTGQDEIESFCERLKNTENLVVFPLYGLLDSDSQQKVFENVGHEKRKVIVATNIAETTITIEGIKFVIDCGYVKQNVYKASAGMDVLQDTRISKAQAEQRKGRAGRTASGKCYRLYSEATYASMLEETMPNIMCINLSEMYLKLKALGLNPVKFDFIDPPKIENLIESEKELQNLDLLDDNKALTKMGKEMSDFPVAPIFGKVLLSSATFECAKDVVTILSMMTDRNPFKRCNRQKERIQVLHKPFQDPYGDQLSRLRVFNAFLKNKKSKQWCYDNFLNYDILTRVDQARDQLLAIMVRKNIPLDSLPPSANKDPIIKAIIRGYYRNICVNVGKGKYIRYVDKETLYIHPGSCLFNDNPNIILFHEIIQTKKPYMHGIMKLDESILICFPTEMKKIKYERGVIPYKSFQESLGY